MTHPRKAVFTKDFDTDSAFASNKFTVPAGKAGIYAFHAELFVQSSDDIATCQLDLHKNDTTNTGSLFFERSNGEATSTISTPLFGFEEATAGRLIHISAQKSGSELQLWVDGTKTVSGSDISLGECKNIPPTNEANLYVGTRGDVDSYLDGKLSQIIK